MLRRKQVKISKCLVQLKLHHNWLAQTWLEEKFHEQVAYGSTVVIHYSNMLTQDVMRSVVQKFSIFIHHYEVPREIMLDRQGNSQTAKIHELIKLSLPPGLWLSQK